MRRRGANHLLHHAARDPWVAGPIVAVALLVLLVGLPRACSTGQDAYRHYRVAQWHGLIDRHAHAAGLDPALVRAVVLAESSGNPHAHSHANAQGLMQITPLTHQDAIARFQLPAGDLFDPDYNLRVGTAYLAHLLDRFDHDRTLALAAYHMGPTRVAKLRRENPQLTSTELVAQFAGPQTRAYVQRVLAEARQ